MGIASVTSTPAKTWPAPMIERARIIRGYFGAITGATIAFVIESIVRSLVNLAPGKILVRPPYIEVLFLVGISFWVIALLTALLPVIAISIIALRFRIGGVAYYVACGAVTAAVLTPVFVQILDALVPNDEDLGFLGNCIKFGARLLVDGVSGALVFWYIAGRHIGRTVPAQSSP